MKNKEPLISVVVAIYNQERYIRETLESICTQTHRNLEIILVDDGSTDSTGNILAEYAKKDARIKIIQQENKRAGAARNRGTEAATGKYIWYPDSDDLFEPKMLERMVKVAETKQSDVVMCRAEEFYPDGSKVAIPWQINSQLLKRVNTAAFTPAEDIPYSVFQFAVGWAWDKLFNADFVAKCKLKYAEIHHAEDAAFVYPALVYAKRVSIIDDVFVHYRKHGGSVSASLNQKPEACCEAIDDIRRQLEMGGVSETVWDSFNCWSVHYICWNINNMSGVAAQEFRDFIINKYEPEHRLLEKIKPIYETLISQRKITVSFNDDAKQYMNMTSPSVSVIVPTYNASLYLREALDSLLNQTYHNFEVICVNDGSTDNSIDILHEYAARDHRFRVLDGKNGGYGKAMNRGMDAAAGKCISILEPDDYYAKDTIETLFNMAEEHNLDIAKGAFQRFYEKDGKRHFFSDCFLETGVVVCPRKNLNAFKYSMNTWTCIYRTEFIRKHNIRHNETPGASYQDNGMHLLTFAYADRVMCTYKDVYFYRQDNQGSSINALCRRPYAMRDEYKYIKTRLMQDPDVWKHVEPAYVLKRMDNHMYVYGNISDSIRMEYLEEFRKELIEMESMDWSLTSDYYRSVKKNILISPLFYLLDEALSVRTQEFTKKEVQKEYYKEIHYYRKPKTPPRDVHTWFYTRTPHKIAFKFFGIPIYSRNKKNGRKIYRLFGVKYRIKQL